ncbi:MAG: hypothetical protein AB1778_05965 [Candidatus Bipolaricaulota bacterium]
MDLRALAVDWLLDHASVERIGFFESPSFSAFDAVFVDATGVPRHWSEAVASGPDGVRRTDPSLDFGLGRTLRRWMTRRREEADDLLRRRGGVLVARLLPRGEPLDIGGADAPPERIDRFSWLPSVSLVDRQHQLTFPANGRFVPRQGDDVVFAGSGRPFEQALRELEGRLRYAAVYEDLLSTPIERFATVLARNRVGHPIALEVPFDDGRLVLLPFAEGVSPVREADILLHAARETTGSTRSPRPDWLPGYLVPGEEALADELAGLAERQDALAAKVAEIEAKLAEATRVKPVLYAKGRTTFGAAVAESFRALGFSVEPHGEVWRVSSDEGDALVAAEASEEPRVGRAAYGELLRALEQSIADGEDPHKGILVVSGSRELDPRRRPQQFAAEVLRGAQAHAYCLLTSYQLFKLVAGALAERGKKALATSRKLLLETDGEFRGAGDA